MQAARRDPGHEAGKGDPAAALRARKPLARTLFALILLWAAWAHSAASASPQAVSPAAPRAVPSTAQLAGGAFDDGRWQAAGPAAVAAPLALAVDPARSDHVYLATEDGVYMSRDEGRTWAVTALPGLVAFASHPGEPAKLFAVTATKLGQLQLWRSEDRGWSWRPGATADPGMDHHRPRPTRVELALAPSDPGHLWVGAVFAPSPEEADAPSVARLWASRDGGASLGAVPLPGGDDAGAAAHPPGLALAALADGTLFVTASGVLHRLPPGASAWQPARRPAGDGPGTPHGPALRGARVVHLAAGGDGGRILYTAVTALPTVPPSASARIYRSADGGAQWSPFGIGLAAGPVTDLVPVPRRRSEIAVAVAGAGVFTTHGDAWSQVTPGLPGGAEAALLAIAPGRRNVLWAATAGGELYRRAPPPPGCTDDADTLCLAGRFRVDVLPGAGGTGRAQAVPLTGDGGWFWFGDPQEPEVVVRATATPPQPPGAPQVWTVYASSLSTRPLELRVHDAESGLGEILRAGDGGEGGATLVATFPAGDPGPENEDLWFAALPEGGCGGDSIDLCLHQGRFEVAVDWLDSDGAGGAAIGDRLTPAAGWFRFLDPGEPELVVKILDRRRENGHWQVAFASLSELGFELTVTDRQSGEAVVYEVDPGAPTSHHDPAAIPDPDSGPSADFPH